MEHLITEKEWDETISYYSAKYKALVEKGVPPAAACTVLLCGMIDTALRVVFSEDEES